MSLLHLDFETRSPVDLRKTGVHKYAEHPDTGIWLASWAFDEEEPQTTWFLGPNAEIIPSGYPAEFEEAYTRGPVNGSFRRVLAHVRDGGAIYAHNAEFEAVMWAVVLRRLFPGIPVPKPDQWFDTLAEAAAMALPRNLANLARVLGLAAQKDEKGGRVMLQLARPRKYDEHGRPIWWDDPAKLETLATYGRQDIRTERGAYHALRRLGERERRIYLLDKVVNERGIRIDVPLVRAMKDLAEQEIDAQDAKLREATEGVVESTTQVARIRDWLATRGVETDSIDKAHLRDLLSRSDLPEDVSIALSARSEAAKSSVKKLGAMLDVTMLDGRARGLLLYHAARTGRWAGRTIQPHNFPRGEVKDIESYIPSVLDGSIVGRNDISLLTVLSSMLRSTIIADPGNLLYVGDYSAIEARGVAWAAQDLELLEAFRDGRPIYKEMAAQIYDKPVAAIEKGTIEYQIGKNAILGAGYGMGPVKFRDMVKLQTGIEISEEFAEHAIATYRRQHPAIKNHWYAVDKAAIRAVENPGAVFRAGPIKFTARGAYLWMILPSGRPLAYFQPKIVERETPWGDVRPAVEISHENQVTRQWERSALYGGLLVENEVQAISRDVMAEGMLAVEANAYPLILTVHDEIVSEREKGGGSVEEFIGLMSKTPEWAPGLPIAAEGWRGERYRK